MKIHQVLCLICILGLTTLSVFAKETNNGPKCTLSGIVQNNQGEPIEFCTLVLRDLNDSTIVAGAISAEQGRFVLKNIFPGDYEMQISHVTYEKYQQIVHVTADMELPIIVLSAKNVSMQEVVVRGQFLKYTFNGYTMEMQNNPVSKGKSISEALPFLPGFTNYDGLKINGLGIIAVYINGRKIFNPSELNNLRAENVKRIEVIPFAGVAYGEQIGGIIKITMRRLEDRNYYGSLQAKTGMAEHGNLSPEGNWVVNYRIARWNFYNMTSYSYKRGYTLNETIEDFQDEKWLNNSQTTKQSQERTINCLSSVVYDITSHHSVGASWAYYQTDNDPRSYIHSVASDYDEIPFGKSGFSTVGKNKAQHYYAAVDYLGQLDHKGSNVNARWNYYFIDPNNRNSDLYLYQTAINETDSLGWGRGNSHGPSMGHNAQIRFELNTGQKSKLFIGGEYSYAGTKGRALYELEKEGEWLKDSSRSDRSNSKQLSFKGYAEWQGGWNKLGYSFGLSVVNYSNRYTTLRRDTTFRQNYTTCIPGVILNYFIDQDKGTLLRFSYKRFFSLPSVTMLDPQIIQTSTNTFSSGNPDLKSEKSNIMMLAFVLKNKLQVTTGVVYNKDIIYTRSFVDPDRPLITLSKPVNFGKNIQCALQAEYPFQLFDWWFFKPTVGISYNKYSSSEIGVGKLFAAGVLMNSFTLPRDFGGTLIFQYLTSQRERETFLPNRYSGGFDIYKYFFNKKLQLNFGVSGFLSEQQRDLWTKYRIEGYTSRSRSAMYTPNYSFSLTYHFKGGKSDKKVKVVPSGAIDSNGL